MSMAAARQWPSVAHRQLEEEDSGACFKTEVKAKVRSSAGDEAAACSGAEIEDDRWWRRHDGF
jgi:hypothetical protein